MAYRIDSSYDAAAEALVARRMSRLAYARTGPFDRVELRLDLVERQSPILNPAHDGRKVRRRSYSVVR
jgi:hypothetical protein